MTRTHDEWGDARHGTTSGYIRHRKLGEEPCATCRAAKSAYDRRQLDVGENRLRARLQSKAQQKAYVVLAHRYPEEYHAVYEWWRNKLYRENNLEPRVNNGWRIKESDDDS